jgi:rhomboid family GlyGly-CTERM serine protease
MRVFVYLAVLSLGLCQLFFDQFIYLRADLAAQPWRLWTAHWVHITAWHWGLNAAALALLPEVFWTARPRLFALLWLLLPVLISLMFSLCLPSLNAYAGLSGVLHGLYLALALDAISSPNRTERRMGWVIAVGLVAKVSYEAYSGSSQTAALIGANVILQAHQYGAVLGVLVYIVERGVQRLLRP